LDINFAGNFLPIAGDLSIRARMLKVRADRLLRRQLDFAAYCRAQAATARQHSERSRFPELAGSMLRVALSYERIAEATEELVRRFAKSAADPGVLDQWPGDAEAA
jgi:hypothetical protein